MNKEMYIFLYFEILLSKGKEVNRSVKPFSLASAIRDRTVSMSNDGRMGGRAA